MTSPLQHFKSVFQMEGPVVKLVILKADGSIVQQEVDMTPRINKLGDLLGGQITFIGQYAQLQVLLIKNRAGLGELNPHKLQPPFHKEKANGDIVLLRMDDNAVPVDFTQVEYEEFLKQKIDPKGDDEEKADICEEMEIEEEEEDEEGGQTAIEGIQLLVAEITEQFESMHNRKPTKEELQDILRRVYNPTAADLEEEGDSENDEDYNPDEDIEEDNEAEESVGEEDDVDGLEEEESENEAEEVELAVDGSSMPSSSSSDGKRKKETAEIVMEESPKKKPKN